MEAALSLVSFFYVLHCTYASGEDTFSANLCSDPVLLLNSTSSVLPGSQVTITCSVIDGSVVWNSSQFAEPVIVNNFPLTTGMELAGAFTVQFNSLSVSPVFCATATATITNVQESMDGLDLTCQNTINSGSSSTVINVIDPPGVVVFDADQDCGNVVTNWTTLPDNPCPIIGYSVSISGISVLLTADQTNYTHPISDSDCGNTIEISVFAVSAAGTGSITNKSLLIVCTPTNVSVMSINDTHAVVQWTPMDVTGVVGYEVMSMSVAESPTGSTVPNVSLDVNMVIVQVDVSIVPVTFTVTSLLAGNEICYDSQTTLPVLKNSSQITTNFGAGIVTFPFLHLVMTSSLSVKWSPASGICVGALSGMDVIVICTELTNDVEYIVTVEVTLIVNGKLLLVRFSESFTPTTPPAALPIASATAIPNGGPTVLEVCNYGFAVGLSVSLTFLITIVLSSLLTVLVTRCLCVGGREKKTTPTTPAFLYEIPSTDPEKESLKMSPNAAYGHVQPRSTAHASSMYDNVAL